MTEQSSRQAIQSLFPREISDDDKVKAWKLNAYGKTLTYGIIPMALLFLLVFAGVRVWAMFFTVIGVCILLAVSLFFVKIKKLNTSVNLTIFATSCSSFVFLFVLHREDSLWFTVFLIIIAGIFLNLKNAIAWAIVQSAALVIIALTVPGYTVFPSNAMFNTSVPVPKDSTIYFSSIIVLYFASALIGLLFQRYFSDLLKQVTRSHDEKLLLESELFQAQKLESIGLLASGIAHDFGKGLSSIKSCASLILKKAGTDKDLIRYAEHIAATCGVIGDSSARLLAFARRTTAKKEAVDLHEVIESMKAMLSYILDKKIEIALDFKARQAMVIASFPQLQTVFMNLAVNASDAMPGGGNLTFATVTAAHHEIPPGLQKSCPAPTEWIVISVRDTGCGMDEATRNKMFTPFFTTKPAEKGTGLGLTIVERIITEHHGSIEVDSAIGRGTTFTIYLPLAAKPP